MKILLVNTIHYLSGGPSVYTHNLAEMLRQNGYEVEYFGMQHENNIDSAYSEYFPSKIDYPELLQEKSIKNIFKVLSRTFYSRESRECMEGMLDEFKPDIVHLQNYLHHLTPSILYPIKKRNIPIVWTLHDSVLVCPNTNLFNDTKREPCTKCNSTIKRLFYPTIYKCKKHSRGASLVASIEAFSFLFMRLYSKIDQFIVPSRFLLNQLSTMGYDTRSKFNYLPLYIKQKECDIELGNYILYIGRLVPEKGIDDLIEAVIPHSDIELIIAGGGSHRESLELKINNTNSKNISLVGHKSGNDLSNLIKNARFIVVPSRCYENAPLSIIESYIYGKPVIGSNIGGIPELIVENETGILFDVKDVLDLSKKIRYLWDSEGECLRMGKNAFDLAVDKHAPQKHIAGLIEIYNKLK